MHSQNHENIRNPLIFLQKWLLSHVFAVPIDTNTYASIRFVSICPFDSLYHFSAFTATLFGNGREIFSTIKKEHHFSQEQLAERLQVSRQAVSKWENGQTAPDLDNIIAMSNLYEVTTDYILIGKERVPKEKEQKRRKRKSGILCLAAGVILTLLLPLFAKLYQGWMFATEGSSYTNSLYYLTELPMLGVTVLAVAGFVIGIWLLKKE